MIAVFCCRHRVEWPESISRKVMGEAGNRPFAASFMRVRFERIGHFLLHSRLARRLAARIKGEWRNGNGRPLAAARWHRRSTATGSGAH
ncbi:hypothetical protein EMIT0347P_50390 [Pseudomonas sp. IT-347P]